MNSRGKFCNHYLSEVISGFVLQTLFFFFFFSLLSIVVRLLIIGIFLDDLFYIVYDILIGSSFIQLIFIEYRL